MMFLPESNRTRQLPVVLWHGMGDSCCNSHSIGAVRNRIQQVLGGEEILSNPKDDYFDVHATLCTRHISVVIHVSPSAGVFVHSIATGEGGPADSESSIFGNVNAQAGSKLPSVWGILQIALTTPALQKNCPERQTSPAGRGRL